MPVTKYRSVGEMPAAGESDAAVDTERAAGSPQHVEQLAPGVIIADRFRLVRCAGRGGMGEVWEARDGDARVALKVMLDPHAAVDRFVREAQLLARASHPALVLHLAHGVDGGRAWLAMQWLEGETLAERLRRAPLSLAETLTVVRRIAGALGALHAERIVHRDVKPANVLLRDGQPELATLLDLGIARTDSVGGLTGTNLVIGTIGYMAPEQARNGRDVDARADVYSLGCVLFECLTGEVVHPGDNPLAVLARLLGETPRSPRSIRADLPRSVDELCASMLARAPADRPRDGGEVAARVDRLAVGDAAGMIAPASAQAQEQQLVLAVVVELFGADAEAQTAAAESVSAEGARVREIARSMGGDAIALGSNGALVVVERRGTAADRAAASAIVARTIVDALGARAGIAAGMSATSAQVPVGAVLERGAALARAGGAREIRVDDLAGQLLRDRFEIDGERLGAMRDGARRGAPFVGREKELALLEATVAESADEGAPRAALVLAPPGTGKTRLGRELAARIDVRVIAARADVASAGVPLAILRSLVRAAVAGDVRTYTRALGNEALADFLGELAGVPQPEPSPELASARADAELMGRSIRRTVREWLAAECARAPVVLLLEDLHWADEASIAHIGEALRACRGPLVVIAFARPEVEDLFHDEWPDVSRIALRALGAKAAERLVRAVLGDSADERAVSGVVERGAGNPFFLEELARFVAEQRSGELPVSVLAILEARIGELDAEDRRILRAASVLGERVLLEGVAAIGRVSIDEAKAALDRAARHELIDRSDGEHRFRHALVREAAYATFSEDDRVTAHRRAAAWIEASDPSPLAMIHHLERAGERAGLIPWIVAATREVTEAGADHASFELADRGLELGASGADAGRLYIRLAMRAAIELDHEHVAECSKKALLRLPPSDPEWTSAAGYALWSAGFLGDMATVMQVITTWLASGVHVERGRLAYAGAYVMSLPLAVLGMHAQSKALLRTFAPPPPGSAEEAWYELAHGAIAGYAEGRVARMFQHGERARAAAVRSEDPAALAFAEVWWLMVHAAGGTSARVRDQIEPICRRQERTSYKPLAGWVAALRAQVSLGPDPDAVSVLRQLAEGDDRPCALYARWSLAQLYFRAGRLSEVLTEIDAARDPLPMALAGLEELRARLALARGDARAALTHIDEAEGYASLCAPIWVWEWIHGTRIEALLALGRRDEARRAAQIALARYEISVEGADAELRAYFETEIEPIVRLLRLVRSV